MQLLWRDIVRRYLSAIPQSNPTLVGLHPRSNPSSEPVNRPVYHPGATVSPSVLRLAIDAPLLTHDSTATHLR
jgi:hypothetical protein